MPSLRRKYRRQALFSIIQSGILTRDSGGGILLAQSVPTQTPEDWLLRTRISVAVGIDLRQVPATEQSGWWAMWTSFVSCAYYGQGSPGFIQWNSRDDLDLVNTAHLTARVFAAPSVSGHGGTVHLSTEGIVDSAAFRKPLGISSDNPQVLAGWDATSFPFALSGDPNVNLSISGTFETFWSTPL